MFRILAINPGSTSTKIAIFEDTRAVIEQTLRHSSEEIGQYRHIADQYEFRRQAVLDALAAAHVAVGDLDAVVGRGGLLRPIAGGTYEVNELMLKDLRIGVNGEHASNLGGLLAYDIAQVASAPAYIVDPVVVDELEPVARLSGLPQIERKSIFHALNQKAIARRAAAELGKQYDEVNLVVAHLGGGVSVGAHLRGKVVDVNNALDGEGSFSPERSGGLPAGDLARLCFSGKYTEAEIRKLLVGKGGLVAYLDTNDGREVVKRMEAGDSQAELVYKAMAYQIAKEIGSCAVVLKGRVDAVVITGGLAFDNQYLIPWIKERVAFIAPVRVYPGEDESLALAEGALRVLTGQEQAKSY